MSWMARGRYALVLASVIILQLGVFSDLRLGGVHPDVTLLIAVVAGLVAGPRRGVVIGFWAGLLIDPVLPTPLGMTALVWAMVGFMAGWPGDDQQPHPAGLSLLSGGSAARCFLRSGRTALRRRDALRSDVGRIVGLISATNALLALPTIAVIEWAEDGRSNIAR
jgi:rod shape-determining protein MreD